MDFILTFSNGHAVSLHHNQPHDPLLPLLLFLSFPFVCVFDPMSFLRFVFRSMDEGLFTGMWTPYQSLPHGRKCLFLSQQPLALYRPSWVGGAW